MTWLSCTATSLIIPSSTRSRSNSGCITWRSASNTCSFVIMSLPLCLSSRIIVSSRLPGICRKVAPWPTACNTAVQNAPTNTCWTGASACKLSNNASVVFTVPLLHMPVVNVYEMIDLPACLSHTRTQPPNT